MPQAHHGQLWDRPDGREISQGKPRQESSQVGPTRTHSPSSVLAVDHSPASRHWGRFAVIVGGTYWEPANLKETSGCVVSREGRLDLQLFLLCLCRGRRGLFGHLPASVFGNIYQPH